MIRTPKKNGLDSSIKAYGRCKSKYKGLSYTKKDWMDSCTKRKCYRSCRMLKTRKKSNTNQWELKGRNTICSKSNKKSCCKCAKLMTRCAFHQSQWNLEKKNMLAMWEKSCRKCVKLKTRTQFSNAQWDIIDGTSLCLDCQNQECGGCNIVKSQEESPEYLWEDK